jgi:hypothetical protein
MADIRVNSKDAFFGKKNEALLDKLLTDDFQRRLGTGLSPRETSRLNNTVEYYMKQVYDNSENSGKSLQEMNREVLKAVVPDFQSYIRRQNTTTVAAPDLLRSDVNSQFDRLQAARQESQAKIPAAPVFQLSLEDKDSVPSIQRYEQLKKQRELEARRLEEAQATLAPTDAAMVSRGESNEIMEMIQSDDMFRAAQSAAAIRDAATLNAREAERVAARAAAGKVVRDVPPDPRMLFLSDQTNQPIMPSTIPNANPTIALPNGFQSRPPLPQDVIKSQGDLIAYKENEYNLMIYSGDRDWVNNTIENRYNFSVNFDPANNRQGFGLSPSTYMKFKNITRIELVKAIMATEGLETVSLKTGTTAYDTSRIINVLSFPYLQVRIDELNTNNYGTNDGVNNSFGVINYDAYWTSDTLLKNKGFTCLIPKFLKCQKVYTPTPLSTLNKLSIQIQRPDGTLVTTDNDALDISGVVLSSMLTGAAFGWGGSQYGIVPNSIYNDTSSTTTGEYIWIQTRKWFNQFSITQGDRIVLKNLTYKAVFTASITGTTLTVTAIASGTIFVGMSLDTLAGGTIVSQLTGTTGSTGTYQLSTSQVVTSTTITATTVAGTTPVFTDFLAYLQRDAGHVVVDVGQSTAPPVAVFVGSTSTTTLTVSSMTSGTILLGMTLNTLLGGTITAQLTGTTGGVGTYTISVSQGVSSTTITGVINPPPAVFIGSIGTTVLTVTSMTSGIIYIGMTMSGASGAINAQVTGTPGGVGTYTVSNQTVTSRTITGTLSYPTASFTGSIAGTTLTLSAIASGTVLIGMAINTATGGTIVALISGSGATAVYQISKSQTFSSAAIVGTLNPYTSFQDGTNGSNKLGYSNFIIIRNNYSETDLKDKGQFNPVALSTALGNFISVTPGLSSGRLLNTSHQLQLVFRVITRELDSTTKIRPDNM